MIDAISQAAPAAAPMGTTGTGTLGKDEFLKLLVAQLSNQDPLNPQDSAAFVAQLADFSSVEQLMNIRDGLDTVAMAQQATTSTQVVGFIGREVTALGGSVHLDGEDPGADLAFSLAGEAESVRIGVVDPNTGETVATIDAGAMDAGEGTVRFEGLSQAGVPLDGNYRFTVTAKGADGESVSATAWTRGRVLGVTFDAGYPELVLEGDRRLTLADVVRVAEMGETLPPPRPADTASPVDDRTTPEDRARPAADAAAEGVPEPAAEEPMLPREIEDFMRRRGAEGGKMRGGFARPVM